MKLPLTISEKRQATFVEETKYEIESLRRGLAKWQEEFAKEPAYAFRWSENAFRDAAQLELYEWTLNMLVSETMTLQDVADRLLAQVMIDARQPQRSTSAQANIMEEERLAAKSRLLERLVG